MNVRSLVAIIVLVSVIGGTVWWLRPGDHPTPDVDHTPTAAAPREIPEFPPIPRPNDVDYIAGAERTPHQRDLRARLLDILRQPIRNNDQHKEHVLMLAQHDALRDVLATLDPADLDIMIELLIEEPDFMLRRIIIDAIAALRTDAAVDALIDHYWRLYERDQESELNYTIAALGRIDTDHSFVRLDEMIVHDLAELHRFRFVEQLGRHSDAARAVPRFLEVADSTKQRYWKTRSRAAWALNQAQDVAAAPKIEALLETEENKYVRQSMVGTLGYLGDVGSISKLESIALTEPNHQTRTSAIRALSRIMTERAREIVERVAAEDENEDVREHAEMLLGRWGQGPR